VPDSLSSTVATLIEPLTSVLRSLLINRPKPGDTCAVLGCGPSASLAIQILDRYLGVGSIIALDHDDSRLKMAQKLGASSVFNTKTQASTIDDAIRSHHDQYVDYVFDALPHVPATAPDERDPRELAMGLLRPGGDYVVYGASAVPQHINMWMILAKGLNVRATPFDVRAFSMRQSARVLEIASLLLANGIIDGQPLITQTVSLLDSEAVLHAFTDYGADGSMKTSFSPERTEDALQIQNYAEPARLL
jgi:L-gulonate 5-dehydrogenase